VKVDPALQPSKALAARTGTTRDEQRLNCCIESRPIRTTRVIRLRPRAAYWDAPLGLPRRRSPSPQRAQLELGCVEWRDVRAGVAALGAEEAVGARVEGKGLEGLEGWVEEPDVADALARVDGEFVGAIDCCGGGREDFGDPIGGQLEGRGVGDARNAFTPPPSEIFIAGAARGRRSYRLPPPNPLQLHRRGLEWFGIDDVITAMSCEQHPVFGLQAVDFERLGEGVEQPEVGDAGAGVDGELAGAIEAAGGGREHFTDPVGWEGEEHVLRRRWHALALPACHVGDDDLLSQVQLWLIQDPPAAGTAVAELHAGDESGAQCRIAEGMRARRARTYEQLSVDNLTHLMLGQRDDVVVRCWSPSGHRHAVKIARRESSPNTEAPA